MHLEAYTRALAKARDAVSTVYADQVGARLSDDLAVSCAMAAVKAFLDVAKEEPVIGRGVEVLRPGFSDGQVARSATVSRPA